MRGNKILFIFKKNLEYRYLQAYTIVLSNKAPLAVYIYFFINDQSIINHME